MAHHDHMDSVRKVVKEFNEKGIKFAIRRLRWTEGDHNVFDDMRYDGNDLEWILANDATVSPNTIIFKDKIEQLYHANDVIKQKLNTFTGWTCNAGCACAAQAKTATTVDRTNAGAILIAPVSYT
jgi:hypothetical protein